MKQIVVLFSFWFTFQCLAGTETKGQAAVAMPDAFSEQAARQVLNRGGNAVDAAIAAQFVLAVTLPEAGNIGGGGFMTLWFDDKAAFLDYREVAPAKAHKNLYLDEHGQVIPELSLYGALASGVPGSVAGMWEAHKKYGSIPWADLLEPAVQLAKQGFTVPEKLAVMVQGHLNDIEKAKLDVNFGNYFSAVSADQTFVQPELAQTLERIQKHGAAGFYQGETAELVAAFMHKYGGLITKQDLANYKPQWREPIIQPWREFDIVTAPPPSSGGIAIVQWLSMYDMALAKTQAKAKTYSTVNTKQYVHLLSEIGKRVFADRAEYLGDPDFYPVPVEELLSQTYLRQRAEDLSMSVLSATHTVNPGLAESEDTTHFSIMDSQGNAVSNTTTINLSFGSSMVVEGAGFLLNDEMDDFSAKPGVANYFGALGGSANAIAPNKRMLSSMTPTILIRNNEPVLITGSPGGTTILSSVYQSILNVVEHKMTAEQAVNEPRFHHQLFPVNTIRVKPGFESDVLNALESMGYTLDRRGFGDLHVISAMNGQLQAGSEASGRGVASVFSVD